MTSPTSKLRMHWRVCAAMGLAAVVLLLSTPDLRPTFEDGFIVESPLPAMLLLAAVGTATGLLHEVAHQLAAARYGVRSRISVSRRLFVIVYQTDLTGLWGLSRRQRTVPISAGMISDAAILGLLLLAALYLLEGTPPLLLSLTRALILLKVTALVFQIEVFMRTDVYALFALATRSRNLWATKGAVARAMLRRATAEDRHLLAVTSPRELKSCRECSGRPGISSSSGCQPSCASRTCLLARSRRTGC